MSPGNEVALSREQRSSKHVLNAQILQTKILWYQCEQNSMQTGLENDTSLKERNFFMSGGIGRGVCVSIKFYTGKLLP